jgi:hypothetical protein
MVCILSTMSKLALSIALFSTVSIPIKQSNSEILVSHIDQITSVCAETQFMHSIHTLDNVHDFDLNPEFASTNSASIDSEDYDSDSSSKASTPRKISKNRALKALEDYKTMSLQQLKRLFHYRIAKGLELQDKDENGIDGYALQLILVNRQHDEKELSRKKEEEAKQAIHSNAARTSKTDHSPPAAHEPHHHHPSKPYESEIELQDAPLHVRRKDLPDDAALDVNQHNYKQGKRRDEIMNNKQPVLGLHGQECYKSSYRFSMPLSQCVKNDWIKHKHESGNCLHAANELVNLKLVSPTDANIALANACKLATSHQGLHQFILLLKHAGARIGDVSVKHDCANYHLDHKKIISGIKNFNIKKPSTYFLGNQKSSNNDYCKSVIGTY